MNGAVTMTSMHEPEGGYRVCYLSSSDSKSIQAQLNIETYTETHREIYPHIHRKRQLDTHT